VFDGTIATLCNWQSEDDVATVRRRHQQHGVSCRQGIGPMTTLCRESNETRENAQPKPNSLRNTLPVEFACRGGADMF